MNEGEDPPDPPKKGYFYGNRSRKRALSRYRGKGNKKSASTRPPTDSQGTNEDMPPILPEHEDLANRVQSKSAQGVITKMQLISALTSAQAQILSHQSTIDANEKKIAQLITKNESLLDSTKRARSSCRESKEVAARAEATSKSLAKELSVKCRSFESDLARAQTEMVLKESIWRQELDSCVSAEVASAMDKAEDRRMRHVKVVERNAEHKLKQAVDAKDKVIKTMSKVLDGNRSSAASAHVALANLRKEHDEEMKLMESKHKKSMAAARKQYNTVINQKNTRIHRLEAQVLEMQQLCDGIAEELNKVK